MGNITAAGQIGLNFDGTQNTNTLDLSSVTQDVDVDVFGDGQVKVTIHVTSSTEYVILAEGVSDVILGKGVNNNVIFSQSGSLVGSLKAAPGTDLNATNFKLSYAADFAGDIVINNTDAAQADDLYDALSAQNADDSWVSFEGFSFNLIDLKSTEDKGLVFSDNIVFGGSDDDYISNTTGSPLIASGRAGNDTLIGGESTAANTGDVLLGGRGDDQLYGLGGDDSLDGGEGNDLLFGGEGTDTVQGGDGDDALYSSVGGDTLSGGKGDDSYVFSGTGWNGTTIDENAGQGELDSLDFTYTDADVVFTIGAAALSVAVGGDSITGITHIERLVGGSANNTYAFQDNWINTILIDNRAAAMVTLDFSQVTANLQFTIKENGTVTVVDSNGNRASFTNVDNINGGQGNNSYLIEKDGSISGNLDSSAGAANTLQSLDYTEATRIEPVVSDTVTLVNNAVEYVLTSTPIAGKGVLQLKADGSYEYRVDPDKDFADMLDGETVVVSPTYIANDASDAQIGTPKTITLTVTKQQVF